ncbi:MAG TPA: sugar transferase [Isosphaeraceae bacterium]|jgi:sugar transferase EpsL|nr:sugar transferase [Isosphaeraceae bacterium]
MTNRLAAVIVLILASPILLVISLLILVTMGWPVLFTQARSGLRGCTFRIVKFRTMRAPRTPTESDDARITRIGRLLRRTSLDELPSLWNILKGDMVFVGPRPLLPHYAQYYDERQARRLEVKPGVTGWCQVRGRNALTWEQKFELDAWYVEHRRARLDLRILALTVSAVLRGTGITHPGHSTMPAFRMMPGKGGAEQEPHALE